MKKFGMIIFMLIVLNQLFSELVQQAIIEQVAKKWYTLQTGILEPTVVNCTVNPDAINPDYWIVEFVRDGWPEGWVIVSADDNCIPILAFCELGSYTVDPVNEAAEDLLLEYSLQIEDAKNSQSNTETHLIWDAIVNQTISITDEHDTGLVTTQWDQWGGEHPYNVYCPIDNHNLPVQRSDVGCVATAVAQILNYYKCWSSPLVVSDRYNSSFNGFECSIDNDSDIYSFPDFSMLNSYLDEVEYKYNNNIALTDNDKAALSFACGILLNMDYSSLGSSAFLSHCSAVYDGLYSNFLIHRPQSV